MLKTGVILLSGFFLFLGVLGFSGSQENLVRANDRADIKTLISKLGHADFRVREKAMKRLEEIGEPALEPLYEAQKSKNSEISQRAKLLIPEIEWRVLPSKTVNGMQFKLVVDKNWRAPRPGQKNQINIRLDIRNLDEGIFRVFPGGIRVSLTDSKGNEVVSPRGSNGSVAAWYSPPLKKNQTFTIELDGSLALYRNNLQFWVIDCFAEVWGGDNLCKGTYYLTLHYRNTNDYRSASVGPLWVGEVKALRQKVEIE